MNGVVSCTSTGIPIVYYFGDTCNVICDSGHELIDDEVWTCQSNGSWSGSGDVCRRGMCVCVAVACLYK